MSDNRQPVRQAVKQFYVDKMLSDKQLNDLQALQQRIPIQSAQGQQNLMNRFSWKSAGAIAASVLLILMMFAFVQAPTIISDAYADTQQDASIHNGLQVDMAQWMLANHITPAPSQYKVEMSKFCQLDQFTTTHLRIAGIEQGKLHLFFHRGDGPVIGFKRSGEYHNMNWKLLKVSADMTLIVMYTEDMREKAVQQILSHMLPGMQA